MTDWSKAKDATGTVHDCAECQSSSAWPGFSPPMLVCRHPGALLRHGGPRSCRDILRHPGGFCGPNAVHFKPKEKAKA